MHGLHEVDSPLVVLGVATSDAHAVQRKSPSARKKGSDTALAIQDGCPKKTHFCAIIRRQVDRVFELAFFSFAESMSLLC